MPTHQKHRGQHSDDKKLFGSNLIPVLKNAVNDLSYLMTRSYSENACLQLVGNHYKLKERQRKAIMRAACSDQSLEIRRLYSATEEQLKQSRVCIDAYNILITVESALSEGILVLCRDGAFRDIASIHSTYKKVEETIPAIRLIGNSLSELGVSQATWYLDKPISNSGRLKMMLLNEAELHHWQWEAFVEYNPDKILSENKGINITSDGWILDQQVQWFNLMAYLLLHRHTSAGFIDLK